MTSFTNLQTCVQEGNAKSAVFVLRDSREMAKPALVSMVIGLYYNVEFYQKCQCRVFLSEIVSLQENIDDAYHNDL